MKNKENYGAVIFTTKKKQFPYVFVLLSLGAFIFKKFIFDSFVQKTSLSDRSLRKSAWYSHSWLCLCCLCCWFQEKVVLKHQKLEQTNNSTTEMFILTDFVQKIDFLLKIQMFC